MISNIIATMLSAIATISFIVCTTLMMYPLLRELAIKAGLERSFNAYYESSFLAFTSNYVIRIMFPTTIQQFVLLFTIILCTTTLFCCISAFKGIMRWVAIASLAIWIFILVTQADTHFILSEDAKAQLKGFNFSGALSNGFFSQKITVEDGEIVNEFSPKIMSRNHFGSNVSQRVYISSSNISARENAKNNKNGERLADELYIDDVKQGDVFIYSANTDKKAQINTGLKYNLANDEQFVANTFLNYENGRRFYSDFNLQNPPLFNVFSCEINGVTYFTPHTTSKISGNSGIWRIDEYVSDEFTPTQTAMIAGEETVLHSNEYGKVTKIADISREGNVNTLFIDTFNDKLLLCITKGQDAYLQIYNTNGELITETMLAENINALTFFSITKNEKKNELGIIISYQPKALTTKNHISAISLNNDGTIEKQLTAITDDKIQFLNGICLSDWNEPNGTTGIYLFLNQCQITDNAYTLYLNTSYEIGNED